MVQRRQKKKKMYKKRVVAKASYTRHCYVSHYVFVITCIFTNIAFSLKTEMFGLNDTPVRKLILDDILQVLKSQVQKCPVTINFLVPLSESFSCPHERLSGISKIQLVIYYQCCILIG